MSLFAACLRQAATFAVSRNPHCARVITPSLAICRLVSFVPSVRCFHSNSLAQAVADGDVVLLERTSGARSQFLSSPLRHGRTTKTHFGDVRQSDIIGSHYRGIVRSSKGFLFRIHRPTLADYVALTPRKVTPIYSGDANVIVSLLDIHVARHPGSIAEDKDASPPLEILEAGTGHGSLTLHLARAIHAANPPPPLTWDESTKEDKHAVENWKARRKAIIHTVDRSQDYSDAARRIVAGFRSGLYAGHVDYHTGNVAEFIQSRVQKAGRQQVFAHIVLDLPDVHHCMAPAADALQDDGVLLVFCPSVTQIAACVAAVREQRLPVDHVQVLELGSGLSGGKPWDVRAARIRNPEKAEPASISAAAAGHAVDVSQQGFMTQLRKTLIRYLSPSTEAATPPKTPERWEMVCRPSVGHRVVGGGFVSMWRRKRVAEAATEDAAETAN